AKKIEKTSSSEITSGGCAAQRSSRFSGGDVCEIMLAPKKEPAFREEKRQVQLLTNFWELKVQSKIVYRHDVAVYLGIPENQKAFDLLRGFRDDTATVARRKLCTDAVRYAIGYYHILSEGSAVVHDGGGMLFSSENLTPALKEYDGVLPITVHELEYEYYRFIRDDVRRHINKITIEITPCREAASSFDMANLSSQTSVADYRTPFVDRMGTFFKKQAVVTSVRDIHGLRNVEMFDFSMNENGRMNSKWSEVNQYIRGVRMNYDGFGSSFSFIASGISKEPIENLKDTLTTNTKAEVRVLSKFAGANIRINPNWPAVVFRTQTRCHYFPMELVQIAANQRVPLEKQLLANSASRADRPEVRLEKIYSVLEALNLHDSGCKNQFLRAFGISVAARPMEVLGFRRKPPGVLFADQNECVIDDSKCNWRSKSDAKFVDGGNVDRIIIVHSDETARLPRIVRDVLITMFQLRGMRCRMFEAAFLSSRNIYEMEHQLEQVGCSILTNFFIQVPTLFVD
ncbi:PAZ domain protein, partial [Necator americanus]